MGFVELYVWSVWGNRYDNFSKKTYFLLVLLSNERKLGLDFD